MDLVPNIIRLNVGGKYFTTTKNTLSSVEDSFFTSLLSGRMPSFKDETGAYFIDRDPKLFSIILNYLRTNKLSKFDLDNYDLEVLRHEAEFYCLTPLVKKIKIYQNLVTSSTCGGDILFQSLLKANHHASNNNDLRVKQIVPFDSGLVVVFNHYVKCYRLSDYEGWSCVFASDYIQDEINLVDFYFESSVTMRFIIAIYSTEICLWATRGFSSYSSVLIRPRNIFLKPDEIDEIGRFSLKDYSIDSMFFVGSQLVAISKEKARVGIWNSSRRWFVQDLKVNDTVSEITAFDKAESDCLFLCSNHGVIYLIDMQKFPLRLKDGDLLINEFYKDPENEEITAISCYHCSSLCCNEYFSFGIEKSIEIAYGTRNGTVRILVHHPETVGQGPQLFQTIQVHLSAISRIMLNNDYLITMCDQLHVRTWSLVRFRGLISTQPGTKTYSSFKIHSFDTLGDELEELDNNNHQERNNNKSDIIQQFNVGPYGHQREGKKQVFVEMPHRNSKYVNILYAANGQKICTLKSVDGSAITKVCIMYQHDTRYRQFIVTGHQNGNVQIWDLTTAMELEWKINDNSRYSSRVIDSKSNLIQDLFQL